jgi:hypothetical protein
MRENGGLTLIGGMPHSQRDAGSGLVSIPFFIPIAKQLVRRKSSWQRKLWCSGRGEVRYSRNYGMHYRLFAHGTV